MSILKHKKQKPKHETDFFSGQISQNNENAFPLYEDPLFNALAECAGVAGVDAAGTGDCEVRELHTPRLPAELPKPAPCPACDYHSTLYWTSLYQPNTPKCVCCQPQPDGPAYHKYVAFELMAVPWQGGWRWIDYRDATVEIKKRMRLPNE